MAVSLASLGSYFRVISKPIFLMLLLVKRLLLQNGQVILLIINFDCSFVKVSVGYPVVSLKFMDCIRICFMTLGCHPHSINEHNIEMTSDY